MSLPNDTYYTTTNDASGSPTSLHKNKQAFFSGNFFGGTQDTSNNLDYVLDERINGFNDSYDLDFIKYEADVIFILRDSKDFRDSVNGLNINYYAQNSPTLSRENFCPDGTRNHAGTSSLSWSFTMSAKNREGTITNGYNINRDADVGLPGDYFSRPSDFLGPFASGYSSCRNFRWLYD